MSSDLQPTWAYIGERGVNGISQHPVFRHVIKATVTKLVGRGLPVPEIALSRVQEYSRLKKLIQDQAINCVIDVGAGEGQSGKLLRRLGFQGYIHSFEPQPGSFMRLERACLRDPVWSCYQAALGRSSGVKDLKLNPQFKQMTSLLEMSSPPMEIVELPVQVIKLDSVFDDLMKPISKPRVFLKVDAEGYDLNVVEGGLNSIDKVHALQVELFVSPTYRGAPHYLDALNELENLGFNLRHLSVVSKTEQDDLMCLNALMDRTL